MQLLYYNCTFALFIFSFAQAGHRGTCLRPLHIFALLLLFAFPRGACGLRNHSCTILAQSVQGLGISQITVLFTTLVPVAAPEVEVWGEAVAHQGVWGTEVPQRRPGAELLVGG